MPLRLLVFIVVCFVSSQVSGQNNSCGQQQVMKEFYRKQPSYLQLNNQIEQFLYERSEKIKRGELSPQQSTGIVTLPVVVHIIHNNGSENISDAQVLAGIQHLNEAFANTGFYDPANGVNTQIQFCMAQRDPNNNSSNGITRNASPYTVMGGPAYYSDDLNVKNINRWNPNCYINIWLVRSIPGSVAGYAYLPSAHGSNVDGIVQEATYFGSSYTNDVVTIHEMGHYLGLYHTFEGSCTNNDCSKDGDKVCDTPPDQSTAGVSCSTNVNSCTTDALSGFSTDQNDLKEDYMDYGNFNCMKVFTQGQADRMIFFIQNTRKSLLNCKSCLPPCPAIVTANFTSPGVSVTAGASVTFNNSSANAATYEWYINGVLQSSSPNLTYSFSTVGTYTIKLVAKSANSLCNDAVKSITIDAVCGVVASFTKSATTAPCGTNINFTNASTESTNYEWYVNGILQASTPAFSYTTNTATKYEIKLIAFDTKANCKEEFKDSVEFTCPVITDFTPLTNTIKVNNTITFTSTGGGATSYQWFVNGSPAGVSPMLTYPFTSEGNYTIQLITGDGTCSSTKNGYVTVTDKCGNGRNLFINAYNYSKNLTTIDVKPTSDGGSIVCGNAYSPVSGNTPASPMAIKFSMDGSVQWCFIYKSNNTFGQFNRIQQTSDGGYIACGYLATIGVSGGVSVIVKLNNTGGVTWVSEYKKVNTNCAAADVIESIDKSFYYIGNEGINALIGKLDAAGNSIWINNYNDKNNPNFYISLWNAKENGNNLIIIGNSGYQFSSDYGLLLSVNKLNGKAQWAKKYYSNSYEAFNDIQILTDGYYINNNREKKFGDGFCDQTFIKTDFSGNLIYSQYERHLGNSLGLHGNRSFVNNSGKIISVSTEQTTASFVDADIKIQEHDPTTKNIKWVKKYNISGTEGVAALAETSGNGILVGCWHYSATSPSKILLMRLDEEGGIPSCQPEKMNKEEVLGIDYTVSEGNVSSIDQLNTRRTALEVFPLDINIDRYCSYFKCDDPPDAPCSIACTPIKIIGADSLCIVQDEVYYHVQKSKTCKFPVNWNTDPSRAVITNIDDSTIKIKPITTGNVKLYASVTASCGTLKDSIELSIFDSPKIINLGPDIQLCKFSSLPLKAGSGFKSYEWNDGSVDSSFTADKPGQYFVAATDYCGNVYRDTINITLAPDVPFDLGPDLSKCANDTINITAPGNFAKYTWAANYNINTTNGAAVKIWPAKDTSYSVVAEVANGCIVIDTIRVKVNKIPPIDLGNDTSFCAGDSILLQAPAGFTGYLWQDNSTGNSFTASQEGKYWLQAKAPNGCISKDTLEVLSVYSLPAVQIGSDITICENNNYIFNVGSNYKSYLWQDGSSSRIFTTNQLGKYWVRVTDNNNCINSDTAHIIAFKPSPKDFISKTIEVCKFRPTPITAIGNWKSYNWSNGSSASGISLSASGTYWLEVTNADGCKARETFVVTTKECIKGIFFPNAFTPGKRGENNLYKPLVYADIVSYRFVVYNRFGQKIFETTDISKGWDGTINGKLQDPNTFVWICNYQFINEKTQIEKGSFLLLR
jgi:gliding motility-associated-like protein